MSAERNLTSPHRNCTQSPETTICALVTTANLKKEPYPLQIRLSKKKYR